MKPGTHVIAKAKKLDLSGDIEFAGTVIRVIRGHSGNNTVTYGVKVRVAEELRACVVEVLANRAIPIDTSTEEGLDRWLEAVQGQKVPVDDLPQPDLSPSPDGATLTRGGAVAHYPTTTTSGAPSYYPPNPTVNYNQP